MPLEFLGEIEKLCSEYGYVVELLRCEEQGINLKKEQVKMIITKEKGEK